MTVLSLSCQIVYSFLEHGNFWYQIFSRGSVMRAYATCGRSIKAVPITPLFQPGDAPRATCFEVACDSAPPHGATPRFHRITTR